MRIALITGASSGMGREYALFADASGRYDQLWVVARRLGRLEELRNECHTPVRIFALDLSQRASIDQLQRALKEAAAKKPSPLEAEAGIGQAAAEESLVPEVEANGVRAVPGAKEKDKQGAFEVGLLVCAAGLGKFGTYADLDLDEVDAMVDVNCRALVDVTQVALPYMGRGGRILEFASSAGFQPLPGMNVYAATKAFVISYTRALRRELTGKGIYVTAVCPVWIKTEFVSVARDTANGNAVRHPWPQLSPSHVARWSLFVNRCNYPVATCSAFAFLMRIAGKVIPSPIVTTIWEGLRRL